MNIHYQVELSDEERQELRDFIAGGTPQARKVKRAQILLTVDIGKDTERLTDEQVAMILSTSTSTVFRTKRRFVELGLDASLSEEPRSGGTRKTTPLEDATLIALACSDPPEGRAKWTLRLLAGAWVEKTELLDVSEETVRRRLEENDLKPWQHKMWCIPQFDLEYVARMEDVLDLYAEPADPKRLMILHISAIALSARVRDHGGGSRNGAPSQRVIEMPDRRGVGRRVMSDFEPGQEFAKVKLGDRRRTARVVRVTEQIAKEAQQSLPKLMSSGDLEGAYRIRVLIRNAGCSPDRSGGRLRCCLCPGGKDGRGDFEISS